MSERNDSGYQPKPGQELLAELLRCGHQVQVTAHGNSMHPTIKHGERIIVSPLSSQPVRRGDIVYLQRDDASYVLHRVLRTFAGGCIQTRGDANWRLDDTVGLQAVLGRVLPAERGSRTQLSARANAIRCASRLAASWGAYQRERLVRRLTQVCTRLLGTHNPGKG